MIAHGSKNMTVCFMVGVMFLAWFICDLSISGEPQKNKKVETSKKADTDRKTITIKIPNLPADAKSMELVLIPAGTFVIGSPDSEAYRVPDEGPQHHVTLTKPFYLGKYVVTQAQWQAVMGSNPSFFQGDNLPVEQVSWIDSHTFIVTGHSSEVRTGGKGGRCLVRTNSRRADTRVVMGL